ncbi:unnamed protein product [Rotaria sordida]|uniref:Uncharacterized protein n=1 Tax=Rotaria sordida TaxID=392033 RepID=A0A819CUD1_9BILA|nr:unnamed protein product [Rotaria sordida]CAF3818320.1 unnamed protein product [Rotaria sordida]
MEVENDFFSNKSYLKKINKNFTDLIELIQSNFKPLLLLLSSKECLETKETSFEYLQEFNGSNQNRQIDLLSMINDFYKLCLFLSLNPLSYVSHYFIEELYQLALNTLQVKQHLAFYCEDILLTLAVCYDDDLRFSCFKLISLLMNESQPTTKDRLAYLNRICYESLYDFHIYYDKIKSFTIESKIIDLTKQDINDLINKQFIRKDLEEKIIEAIYQLGGYVFIKMHRSPKDAYQNLCKEINDEWSRYWNLKSEEDARLYFMRVENIYQLKLLFKTSDRLHEDLKQIDSDEKLILRKWINSIPNEYRCFVCNRQVNAVSTYQFNQQSINNEKQIKDLINSKSFEDIILKIPYSHAVVDCSIDLTNSKVTIIEVNPFSKRSAAAKFSWTIDKYILYYYYQNNQSVFIKL